MQNYFFVDVHFLTFHALLHLATLSYSNKLDKRIKRNLHDLLNIGKL